MLAEDNWFRTQDQATRQEELGQEVMLTILDIAILNLLQHLWPNPSMTSLILRHMLRLELNDLRDPLPLMLQPIRRLARRRARRSW